LKNEHLVAFRSPPRLLARGRDDPRDSVPTFSIAKTSNKSQWLYKRLRVCERKVYP
jgi:hypothetical protein